MSRAPFSPARHHGTVVDRVAKLFAREGRRRRSARHALGRAATAARAGAAGAGAGVSRSDRRRSCSGSSSCGRESAPAIAEHARADAARRAPGARRLLARRRAADGSARRHAPSSPPASRRGFARCCGRRSTTTSTPPEAILARADVGSPAHVPVGRPVRSDALESGVTDAATPGTLYVVSTPIGNMGDFSFRAVEVLQVRRRRFSPKTRDTRATCSTRYEIATPPSRTTSTTRRKRRRALVARLDGGRVAGARVGRRDAAPLRSRARGWFARRSRPASTVRADSRRVGAAGGARRLRARRRTVHLFRIPYTDRAVNGAAHWTRFQRCGIRRWSTNRPIASSATLSRARAARKRRAGRPSWPAK